MTSTAPSSSRSTADLKAMRRSTLATLWLVVIVAGLVQVVSGVAAPIDLRQSTLIAATVGSVVVACVAVPLLIREAGTTALSHPLIVVLLALSAATWAAAVADPFAGWGWAFTLAIAGGMTACFFRGWGKASVVLATYAAIAVGGLIGSQFASRGDAALTEGIGYSDVVLIATIAVFTVMPLSTVWALQVVLRLDYARSLASELAVARERLRFATDLHDIQGHNLQVIALKSELAERLLSGQPERAAQEIAAIRVIAHTAIEDTRAVVNDYRTVTVAVEVRNAAAVLRAAGIVCGVRVETTGMPTAIGAVFAVAIREAATNILKHSAAAEAEIDLGLIEPAEYRLTVTNDGAGPARHGGTGLSGLSSRVASLGGAVETQHTGDSFTLVVRVPAASADSPSRAKAISR
ncbi:sensor histidine kinase [Leifsonia sp. NPDC058292]|uniref:sensor histidine kinase n=1 Tax=Leifsonia sp. NPDC058292 TaxID=3346428 RepID=UPI0036DE9121